MNTDPHVRDGGLRDLTIHFMMNVSLSICYYYIHLWTYMEFEGSVLSEVT